MQTHVLYEAIMEKVSAADDMSDTQNKDSEERSMEGNIADASVCVGGSDVDGQGSARGFRSGGNVVADC